MRIIAFDQSITTTGYCLANMKDNKIIESGIIQTIPDCTDDEKTYLMATGIKNKINEMKAEAVFFEDCFFRFVKSYQKLVQIRGALIYICESMSILYDFIPSTRWKSYFKIKGKNQKEQSVKVASAHVNDFIQNDNQSDAILIAKYVLDNVTFEVSEDA